MKRQQLSGRAPYSIVGTSWSQSDLFSSRSLVDKAANEAGLHSMWKSGDWDDGEPMRAEAMDRSGVVYLGT
jgi:hypothetical protein